MRVPKSFSGSTQLLGKGLEGKQGVRALITLPPEPGLPGLFGSFFSRLQMQYHDFSVYRRDRDAMGDLNLGKTLQLDFSGEWKDGKDSQLAVMYFPKEKELAAYALTQMRTVLPRESAVFLVGPKRGGIASARPLVEKFLGTVRSNRSARHSVLLEAVVGDVVEKATGKKLFEAAFRDRVVHVVSYPGVFCHGKLDPGTALLMEVMGKADYTRALDWGCGCGVLGAALRLGRPGARVDLVDSNALALQAARETLDANDLETAGVWATDGLSEVDGTYDLIVSNPPFHSGIHTEFTVTERFIREAGNHLSESGRLLLVVNTFINYFPALRETFPIVKVPVETPRYRIIEARKS